MKPSPCFIAGLVHKWGAPRAERFLISDPFAGPPPYDELVDNSSLRLFIPFSLSRDTAFSFDQTLWSPRPCFLWLRSLRFPSGRMFHSIAFPANHDNFPATTLTVAEDI